MFSQNEENYIKSLINTYHKDGYNYYICHTVTESDNVYDVYIYFSKKEIKAISRDTFDVTDGVYIQLDSSSRNDNSYNPSTHSRIRVVNSNFTDVVSVNSAEFIYTNSVCNYDTSKTVLNPDLNLQGTNSYLDCRFMAVCIFVLIVTFLYTFFTNILRVRK